MSESADAVIIGGGAIGCSVAFNLAYRGLGKVILLEREYLTAGSTGRCGAGIRQQWGTEINCLLARRSCQIFSTLPDLLKTDFDIEFRQSGYLLLAYEEPEADLLRGNVGLQQSLGIPSYLLSPEDAVDLVPELNANGVLLASFCQEDGHVNPFRVTFAYAEAASNLGAFIRTFCPAIKIESRGGCVYSVITPHGRIYTPVVINAAGPLAAEVGRLAGLTHPVEPERHQILVTEPLEPIMGPMIVSLHHKVYCQQVPHGGFLMGLGNPQEPKGINFSSSWDFLLTMARNIVNMLPILRSVCVVRQWAGHYGVSPDSQPIVGESDELGGYFLALGCGKGFMLSPVIGELVASLIVGDHTELPVEKLHERRFESGQLIVEPAVV